MVAVIMIMADYCLTIIKDGDYMVQSTIESLVAQTTAVFLENGYNHRSIHEKETIMRKIVLLHKQNGYDYFNPDIMDLFLQESERRYQQKEIGKIRFRFYQKTAAYLSQFHATGQLDLSHRNTPCELPPYFANMLGCICSSAHWTEKEKPRIRSIAMPYFKWLVRNNISDLSEISEYVVREYMIDCSNRMMLNSVDATKRLLKKLHGFLYNQGLCSKDYADILSFSVPTEYKIKKPVPHKEIAAVLDIIDRSSPKGKRDYAVILLGAVTGLRSVDIANLTFSDIDWINGEIRISQSKTGKTLALPLTKDVGSALQDYITNGRFNRDLPFVFLRSRSPYEKMCNALPYSIFNSYRTKLGLEQCSFHGLRRAVGTNMVIAGVPVTTVSQVLGHSGINATKQYISLDSVHLKECALSLCDILPKGDDES